MIEADGTSIEASFHRKATARDGIDPAEVPNGDVTSIGWVKRSDADDFEGFLLTDIRATPEADVRIAIGHFYEVVHPERRVATQELAESVREATGVTVDVEVTEYERGYYGLGPVEWTAIFIGQSVASTVIGNLTNKLYAKAKQMLLARRAKGDGRPRTGFVIYGPNGEELKRWDTSRDDEDDHAKTEPANGEK